MMDKKRELDAAIKHAGLVSGLGRLAGGALGAIGGMTARAAKPAAKAVGKGAFNTMDMVGKGVNNLAGGAVKVPLNFANAATRQMAPNSPIAKSISNQFAHASRGVTRGVKAMNAATNPVARALRAGVGGAATYQAGKYIMDDRRKHPWAFGVLPMPTWGERHR